MEYGLAYKDLRDLITIIMAVDDLDVKVLIDSEKKIAYFESEQDRDSIVYNIND
jgi:hypothetical protein